MFACPTCRTLHGAWGHTQCCERAYARNETTTRIKGSVTPKVGSDWRGTYHFEKGISISNTAMYGSSLIEPTFEQIVEMRAALK